MTLIEMKSRLLLMTGEQDDDILSAYLDIAGDRILERMRPFGWNDDSDATVIHEVPAKYQSTQLEIAAYLLNKRGAEGETAHNENGINRSYEAASVPPSMLKHVVPYCAPF